MRAHAANTARGYQQSLKTQNKQISDKDLNQTRTSVKRTGLAKACSAINSRKFAPLGAVVHQAPEAEPSSELQCGTRLTWFPSSTFAAHLQVAVICHCQP